MSDQPPKQPFIYEGIDPEPEAMSAMSAVEAVADTVKQTVNRATSAFETAKKPGMPLSILANVAREAPLGALFAAFLVGVMVGRRR